MVSPATDGRGGREMRTRAYLIINSKDLTTRQLTAYLDDFGQVYFKNHSDIVDIGEARKHVAPISYWICKTAEYLKENGDLVEVIENKGLEDIRKLFLNIY